MLIRNPSGSLIKHSEDVTCFLHTRPPEATRMDKLEQSNELRRRVLLQIHVELSRQCAGAQEALGLRERGFGARFEQRTHLQEQLPGVRLPLASRADERGDVPCSHRVARALFLKASMLENDIGSTCSSGAAIRTTLG